MVNSWWHRTKNYWLYWSKAGNAHGLHSPFVFELYTQVIGTYKEYYAFKEMQYIREQLLDSDETIEVQDFGAGQNRTKKRSVSFIARSSAKPPETGELLFKLVNRFQPKTMLELGTSLGISTLYQHFAKREATFYTLEGCPNTAAKAQQLFKQQHCENLYSVVGKIDETLPPLLEKLPPLDYIFFDANHRYEPTMRYFEWCAAKAHNNSLFIFDDIYWSEEMTRAWKQICADPRVSVSIDLFDVGLVFFRKEQEKEHFVLRF